MTSLIVSNALLFVGFAVCFFGIMHLIGTKVSLKLFKYLLAAFLAYGASSYTLDALDVASAVPQDVRTFHMVVSIWIAVVAGALVEAMLVKGWELKKTSRWWSL